MNKVFRLLYDLGPFGPLIFLFSCIFLMGGMWNKHYVDFCFIGDTYTEEKVVIKRLFSLQGGSLPGKTRAEAYINGKRVTFFPEEDVRKGKIVTIWYSSKGSPKINAFLKREGEKLKDLQKRMMRNFFKSFMILNMPLLLLIYFSIKFYRKKIRRD